jgi:alpha-tubulin suppressor-like RCC1 family protein
MKKWLTRCAVAAELIGIVLLVVLHQVHAPPISVGRSLPPGKVRPQLVNSFWYATLLAPDGSLWAWGGLPGFGLPESLSQKDSIWRIPHRLGSDSDWRQVACCQNGPVALKNDGSLWIWGFRQSGPNPTRIGTETNWSQICADWNGHNLWLKTDGSLWTWDSGDSSANANSPPVPKMVSADRDWRMIATGEKLKDVNARNFAIKSTGTLWEWDAEGAASNHLTPRQVMPDTKWQAISASPTVFLALKTDGTIWTTSRDLTNVASALVPDPNQELTQIGPDTDWTEVYAGKVSFYARKKDGSWWVSGWNREGQLGLPENTGDVASPQRLPFDFDPWAFSGSAGFPNMLGKDGKLWTWGYRLGRPGRSAARGKFDSLLAPAVKRFPSLGFLIGSDLLIDQTPHLLWKLPPEVRRSLGTGPNSGTNHLTTTKLTNAPNK